MRCARETTQNLAIAHLTAGQRVEQLNCRVQFKCHERYNTIDQRLACQITRDTALEPHLLALNHLAELANSIGYAVSIIQAALRVRVKIEDALAQITGAELAQSHGQLCATAIVIVAVGFAGIPHGIRSS